MKKLIVILFFLVVISGCTQKTSDQNGLPEETLFAYPHIAGYVKSGTQLLGIEGTFDIVYTSDIDSETAGKLKDKNPQTVILYQSVANYMYDSAVPVIEATTGMEITDDFWLKNTSGQRCGYGWTPELWAVDFRKQENNSLR